MTASGACSNKTAVALMAQLADLFTFERASYRRRFAQDLITAGHFYFSFPIFPQIPPSWRNRPLFPPVGNGVSGGS
jgi:hypothetical protein